MPVLHEMEANYLWFVYRGSDDLEGVGVTFEGLEKGVEKYAFIYNFGP
jgi:hypothetical protein